MFHLNKNKNSTMNIYRIYYRIKEIPSDIKHFYQRAKKGYSYQDVWSIHSWFEEVVPKMLAELKNNKRGCPVEFTHNEDGTEKDFEKAMEEWQNVLERMIFCFKEMNEDTCSMKNEFEEEYFKKPLENCFVPCGEDEKGEKMFEFVPEEREPELKENYRRKMLEINEYREKMKNEGFELFSKYFWNLWD